MASAVDIPIPEAGPAIDPVERPSARYVWWALFLLMLVNTVNFMDRQVINILGEPIKRELGLLDWQLGLMNGLAFAALYTVLGLPLARLAERKSRPLIIAGSITVWSGFTALCGVASSFTHLVMARVGVGIGEAGCTPAATSLILDYVPKEKRASALAFYAIAAPLGGVVGLGVGGIVADAYGWRVAFVAIGLLGLPLGALTALLLVEPRRRLSAAAAAQVQTSGFLATLRVIRGRPTFWLTTFATSGKVFIGYGHAAFIAPFLLRNHAAEIAVYANAWGLKPVGFVGLVLGLTAGPGNIIGALYSGRLADRLAKRDVRAYVTIPAVAILLQMPFYISAFLVGDVRIVLALLIINSALGTAYYGTSYATIQGVVPAHMRATAVAIFGLVTTLIGLGIGPLLVGALSDLLAVRFGFGTADGIRYALIASLVFYPISFFLFWRARSTIVDDMED